MNEWMNERINEWMNEWMNGWMNKWKNEWMNEYMTTCIYRTNLHQLYFENVAGVFSCFLFL